MFQLQKLLFSATLSQNPEKLQQLNLFQPKLFTSVVKSNKAEKNAKKESVTKDMEIDTNTDSSQLSSKFSFAVNKKMPDMQPNSNSITCHIRTKLDTLKNGRF